MADGKDGDGTAICDTAPKRKVWSTPTVILATLGDTKAHVTVFTDGHSPTNNTDYGS